MMKEIKLFFRNARRFMLYYLLNWATLTIGISSAILIFLWGFDEYSFDKFHHKSDHLYRVLLESSYSENDKKVQSLVPAKLEDVLDEGFPSVSATTRYSKDYSEASVKNKTKELFTVPTYVDHSFFGMFDFNVLNGDPNTFLQGKNEVVLSKKISEYYFGSNEPLGEMVELKFPYHGVHLFKVVGVIEDSPDNSSIEYEILLPFDFYISNNRWLLNWGSNSVEMFLESPENYSQSQLDQDLKDVINTNCSDCHKVIFTQKFADQYLYGDFDSSRYPTGRIQYLRILAIAIVFILVMTCFNYVNLSTTLATSRTKEIGIRKAIGGNKGSVIRIFYLEALLTTVIACVTSFLVCYFLLPGFNEITGKALDIPLLEWYFLSFILILILGLTFFSGLYPAIFAASFDILNALKGNLKQSGGQLFRKYLIGLQFTITLIILILTFVLRNQIQFIQNRDLGYNGKGVLSIKYNSDISKNFVPFKQALLKHPEFSAVSRSSEMIHNITWASEDPAWQGKPTNEEVLFNFVNVDEDFFKAFDLQLIEGRSFDNSKPGDSEKFIVNQTAVNVMGMDKPLEQYVDFWHGKGDIIGIADDFHFASIHESVKPLIIMKQQGVYSHVIVKIDSKNFKNALGVLNEVYSQFSSFPLSYQSIEDEYSKSYLNEIMIGKISNAFATISLIIAALGLFGLSSYTLRKRNKEIGIRKVLGAPNRNVLGVLVKDFVRPLVVSVVISIPAAYYFSQKWLDSYAYAAKISSYVILLPLFLIVLMIIISVSLHTIQAFKINPVNTLKTED